VTLGLRFAAVSHVGLLREGNEDSVYAGPQVLAVADGMGGHAAGEVASAVAIAALAHLDSDAPGSDLLDVLRASAESANEHLRDMVAGDPTLEGMGTTLTAMLFADNRLGLLHIGDSRAYLLREGRFSQITHDHTLVQRLVDEGRISEREAGTHPQRSLITRALDGRDSIEPDLSVREARPGDRYLLCTDGLTGPVGDRDTLSLALQIEDPQSACDHLVELALRGGGPDNVTVIVADVLAGNGAAAAPVVAGAAAQAAHRIPDSLGGPAAVRARTAEVPPPAAVQADPPVPSGPAEPAPATAGGRPVARRGLRRSLVGLMVAALLAVAAVAGWAYVRSQYYVGVDGRNVAIFRGVTGTVAGVRLAAVDESTELATDRLDRISAAQVEQGIVAANRSDAERIVDRLVERFPSCDDEPDLTTSARPTPSATASPSGAPANEVGASRSPAGSPSASPAPSASASADAATACPAGAS
jgi:protein phosphatase